MLLQYRISSSYFLEPDDFYYLDLNDHTPRSKNIL